MTDDETNRVVISDLKNTLVTTYMLKLTHKEDIDATLKVREACKTLLGYYMIPTEAERYVSQIEYLHESKTDE